MCGNKLTQRHIHFWQQKMSVSLAAQTISSSVADSLEFARKRLRLRNFEDTEGTEMFLRTMDRLFDILNISSPHGRGWKAPINMTNYFEIDDFLTKTKNWILGLENSSGVALTKTQRHIGFIGMWLNIDSVQSLMADNLIKRKWSYILTYKFSQDHLELLFNAIRRAGTSILKCI